MPVEISTRANPVGGTIEFAVTTTDTEPSTWVAGQWDGTWSSTTGKVSALSPLAGNGAELDVVGGSTYGLWARWTVGTEVIVQHVGRMRVS